MKYSECQGWQSESKKQCLNGSQVTEDMGTRQSGEKQDRGDAAERLDLYVVDLLALAGCDMMSHSDSGTREAKALAV